MARPFQVVLLQKLSALSVEASDRPALSCLMTDDDDEDGDDGDDETLPKMSEEKLLILAEKPLLLNGSLRQTDHPVGKSGRRERERESEKGWHIPSTIITITPLPI
jgi:hypothetical protein